MGQPTKTTPNRRNFVIYVSGPITAAEQIDRWNNIMHARDVAISLWELGFTVICPHLNTMFFDGCQGMDHDDWIEADFNIIERCDAMMMTHNWKDSKGAREEYDFCMDENIPAFEDILGLLDWVDDPDRAHTDWREYEWRK